LSEDYYLGQRALSVDIRDLYGQLIDGMQGARFGPANAAQSADATPNGSEAGAVQAILPDPALGAGTIFVDASELTKAWIPSLPETIRRPRKNMESAYRGSQCDPR